MFSGLFLSVYYVPTVLESFCFGDDDVDADADDGIGRRLMFIRVISCVFLSSN